MQALAMLRRQNPGDSANIAGVLKCLAGARKGLGRLGEAEPLAAQPPILAEVTRDLEKFVRDLDAMELRFLLKAKSRSICSAESRK